MNIRPGNIRPGSIGPGEPVCVAEGLTVGYRNGRRRTPVLGGLNLELTSNSFTCLLGPNGSGKSTLLRTFAGMQRPLGGKLTLFGDDIARLRPRQLARRLGVVLTDRVMVGALSVTDLIELGRYPHRGWDGRPGENDAAIVQWAIDITGTQPLAHRDVDELSDGERQRVMIARALAQEPAVLLLDEPTAYLDVSRRVELTALLRSLAAETGKAVLCTTHDLELALRAADRIWLLDPDGAVRVGAPEDLALDGSFSHCFASEGVDFDVDSGSLRMRRPVRGVAHVEGEARPALWAARALERAGYAIANSNGTGPAEITVRCRSGPTWTLEANGRRSDHHKLEDLVARLS